jgi:oligosaccharyltransferase complex subunit epsilon
MPPKSAPEKARSPVESLWKAYSEETPDRLKFVDSFLLFLMLSGIVQFLYCILVINYPFNAFLAGCVLALSA